MNKVMVTLSQSELNKAFVLQRVVDGHLTIREAALVLGLSERHTKRLKKKFLAHGAAGLAHGNRDRKPAHAIPNDVREKVLH
ncbi:MAG: helix-turn-helix domain-containing protein, partial [Bacillota bacterium]